MIVNFFGDFVAKSPNIISIDQKINEILNNAQYNVINFEAPVRSLGNVAYKSGPSISQSVDSPEWLKRNHFNLISLANNHIFDYGLEGFRKTVKKFVNIPCIGSGMWNEAYKPIILEDENIKLAVFSMTELQFGVLHDKWSQSNTVGCAWINHHSVNDIIKNIKQHVDYVIMVSHAGLEDVDIPLPEWRDRYRYLIDCGCDAIIGGHTHVAQGYELYKERPIFYSLGNFCFEKIFKINQDLWNIGECVSLEFKKDRSLKFIVYGTLYEGNCLKLINPETWKKMLQCLNDKLCDNVYMQNVDKICLGKRNDYKQLFSMSGFIHADKNLIKNILRYVLGKCNKLHLLNNIRCESHRWCISRIIENEMRDERKNKKK